MPAAVIAPPVHATSDDLTRFRDLVDTTDAMIWEADAVTFANTFISQSAQRILGYSSQEWQAPGFWADHIHPHDRATTVEFASTQTELLQDHELDYRFIAKDGRVVWLHDSTKVVVENGKARWLRGLMLDITARKQAERLLIESQLELSELAAHTQTVLDNMADGVITLSAQGTIESFNQAAATLFGYAAQHVVGRSLCMLIPASFNNHGDILQHGMRSGESQATASHFELEGKRQDDSVFPISISISQIVRRGQPFFIILVRDVTERRQYEDEIRRLAFYDPLTQLPNRRLLMDRLKHAMVTAARTKQHGALMFLDLDHFKLLNDSLGHDVGDLLLQQVAVRLTDCVREVDSVARLGGDEFVLLLEALSPFAHEAVTHAEAIAAKILRALGQPYMLREHSHISTPSIGIVLFQDSQGTIDDVLKKADVAMYQAKAAGRNVSRFFDPAMQVSASEHAALEKDIRQALVRQEFVLYYQIQVQAEPDGSIRTTGAEALVRWNQSVRGMVSPAQFIPLAEETGLILPLGQWVLETACAQLVAWSASEQTAGWTLAVNVSASQFAQEDFVEKVSSALQITGANPELLKLELTESMLANDVEDIIVKMHAIRKFGVQFSLDDFGTGYSSLSFLKRLPLDQLKIDQSFVRDLTADPNDAAIARTVVSLGHSLGLKVIAEGVESVAQRTMLADMGCTAYQGYYFGRPAPAHALTPAKQKNAA